MSAHLRRGRLEDVKGVLLPIEAATGVSGWSAQLYTREFETPHSHVMIAELDGQSAGFIVYWILADELHILNVAVHPDFQRRGLGRTLVRHAIDVAETDRAGFALLEVRVSNAPAIALYSAMGFKEIGYRKGYYADNGEDAHVLGLLLADGEDVP